MTHVRPRGVQSPARVATFDELADREPTYGMVANVDLVIVRNGEEVSVLYGRCLHRGALLADGFIRGDDIVCGVHNWDYNFEPADLTTWSRDMADLSGVGYGGLGAACTNKDSGIGQ